MKLNFKKVLIPMMIVGAMASNVFAYEPSTAEVPTAQVSQEESDNKSFDRDFSKTINGTGWTQISFHSNTHIHDDSIRITLDNDGLSGGTRTVAFKVVEHFLGEDEEHPIVYLTEGNTYSKFEISGGNNFTIYAKYSDTKDTGTISGSISLDSTY